MNEHDRALLLSVRPRYAHAILNGTKTAEIRRQRPAVHPGTLVIIYATKPVGAIVGTARIADMSCGSPADMWEQHQRSTGVTRAEYDAYLAGAETAYLLFLRRVQRLEPLLTLEQIRSATTFQPPQSYRYLSQHMLHNLVNGHPESQSLLGMLQPSSTQLATSAVNSRQAATAPLPSAATLILTASCSWAFACCGYIESQKVSRRQSPVQRH
jgi:predicted transcriptional regulator